jgi:hypothetical protein
MLPKRLRNRSTADLPWPNVLNKHPRGRNPPPHLPPPSRHSWQPFSTVSTGEGGWNVFKLQPTLLTRSEIYNPRNPLASPRSQI